MSENKKVQFARPQKGCNPSCIYCRVSTAAKEQLNSLFVQVSALTRHVALYDEWMLADSYVEVASSKGDSPRPEFRRLIDDCKRKKIKIVLVKNISRFGRDTVTVLEALQQLRTHDVRVIFLEEKLDTKTVDSNLMISIIESIAQAENESRSANIKMGLNFRAKTGTSKLYQRKCYGYQHDKEGMLTIDEEQAEKEKRSSVIETENGKQRKSTKYSSKRK
ncbi:MAG: recombinase family protein [Paludibacter sp.]|nr:recombinase family protein [Paludibacter sp.]